MSTSASTLDEYSAGLEDARRLLQYALARADAACWFDPSASASARAGELHSVLTMLDELVSRKRPLEVILARILLRVPDGPLP